ncbi:MAG: hypothetical protein QOJ38_1702, partial [Solirubrobacterales bacterium]|nr:hypothetical protein [Solirubrobacterales bacterium]
MKQKHRRAGSIGIFLGAIALLALPAGATALGGFNVDQALNQSPPSVGAPSAPGQPSAPADDPTTQAGTPPDYVPPMHGTNPHGQGTAGTVDLGTAAA